MRKVLLHLVLGLAISAPCIAGLVEGEAAYKAEDYAKAAAELKPLAVSGNPRAQNLLGLMYESGEGVPQSDAKAVALYQQAAAQGYGPAQNNLAARYMIGKGVPEDDEKAMTLLQKSADQGDVDAQFLLGTMYKLQGLTGTPHAHFKSYMYYFIASENGNAGAKGQLPAEVVFLNAEEAKAARAAGHDYLSKHPVHFSGNFP